MSTVSKDIKKQVDTIAGKRRLTILQKFITQNYKKPDTVMRNVVGEYSPNSIMTHLRAVVGHLKQLCLGDGKLLFRYYSNARAQEILRVLRPLASQFEPVNDKTADTTLRNLLPTTARFLESIKEFIGPFTDIKLASALEEVSKQIDDFQEQTQALQETTNEITSMANTIGKLYTKSQKSGKTFEDLVKETKNLQKQLEIQKDAAKEVYEKTRTISKSVERSQEDLDKKQQQADEVMENLLDIKQKFLEEHQNALTRAQEFEHAAKNISATQLKVNSLSAQAHRILHTSHGLGLLNTYKALYNQVARTRSRMPWILGTSLGFIASVVLLAFGYLAVRSVSSIGEFLNNPVYLFQVILIPFSVFTFFFCLVGFKKKTALIEKYRIRAIAVEAYLKITERLPVGSQEHTRAANKIMRHIEEDFGPLSHAVFQSDLETYDDVV